MSGKTISNSETKIEALKLQSSAYGVTIPMVFGRCRLAGNLLDYLGFEAVPHTETQGGKGGGVKVQNTTFTYKADVAMGLCHGPITEIPTIWRGKKQYSGGWLATQINTATETYTPPGSGTMAFTVANAATFLGVVEVGYTLTYEGESGPITQVVGLTQGQHYTASADGVITFALESLRGELLSVTYQWASGVRAQTAMDQLGLTFKPGTVGQAAWSALPPGRDLGYSGLALVAGQGYDLGTGAQVENHIFEVVGPMAYHLGQEVPDVDPSVMLRAVLTQTQGGAGFPSELLDTWADWSTYCVAAGVLVSPAMTEQTSAADIIRTAAQLTNTAPVWSGGQLKMVPLADEAETGNGVTFTPNSTPAYDLDDESYTPSSGGGSPVRQRQKSSADRYNHWRVEFLNRDNQYNTEIAEAKDAADIDEHGLRSAEIVKAHWLCTPAAARKVAQTLMQRSLCVNSEYTVPLPWHYALIEPADLLTLTDTELQMDRWPVRVTVVEENDDGDLTITAEDYPPGTASAAVYPTQAGSGYTANYNADPGNVDTPAIFEAPYTLASTGLEVYAAVRGLTSIWGGYQVWVSLDGTSYKQMGTVYGPSRYGTLAADVTSGASSLDVEGLGATAQLLSGSATDAARLQTLCYLGGTAEEYVAHEDAALTGPGEYTLAGLVRGAHGTTAAAHDAGDTFVRVDDRIAKSGALDPVLIGSTMYFKFTSFNIWGGGQQQLADVDEWPYTITGVQANLAPRTGAFELRLVPSVMTVTANAAGVVSDWSPARTVAQVLDVDGADVTDEWGYSLTTEVNVVATLGGALNNEVEITDFDAAAVQTDYRYTVLQAHGYPSIVDTGQFSNATVEVGTAVSFAAVSPPPVGIGYLKIAAGTWTGLFAFTGDSGYPSSGVRFGGPSLTTAIGRGLVDMTGGPWEMSAFVKCVAYASTAGLAVMGHLSRSLMLTTVSGVGCRFYGLWAHEASNAFNPASTETIVAATSTPVAFGQWAHIKLAYCSDGYLRMWVGGVLVDSANIGVNRRDDLHPDGPPSERFGIAFDRYSSLGQTGPELHICEIRHLVGVDNTSAGYTPPTQQFADGPYPNAGRVGVTASKLGQTDLTASADLVVIGGASPAVQVFAVPASLFLQSDWAGSVTGNSLTAAVKVLVGGIEDQNNWSMAVTADQVSGVTTSLSGKTITATGMDTGRSSGEFRVWLSKPGYLAQFLTIPVGKTFAPQPAQSWALSSPVITLAGDTAGHVDSYTGASSTITPREGGVTATGYTWSVSATTGITASVAGAVVSVTAITDAVDTGTITATGTKSGWPNIVVPIGVTKTRLALPSGVPVANMAAISAYSYNAVGDSAQVGVRYNTNGTVEKTSNGSTWVAAGNWFNPTTAGVGTGKYVRLPAIIGDASAGTGPFGTFTQITSTVTYLIGGAGQAAGSAECTGPALISSAADGSVIHGTGPLYLNSGRF